MKKTLIFLLMVTGAYAQISVNTTQLGALTNTPGYALYSPSGTSWLGQTTIANLTITGNISMSAVAGTWMGWNTLPASGSVALRLGGVANQFSAQSGGSVTGDGFHGFILQNDVASANSSALTVKGRTTGQPIQSFINASGVQVGVVSQRGIILKIYPSTANPTTSDIPIDYMQLWYNTSLDEIRLWMNKGGTMIKSAVFN